MFLFKFDNKMFDSISINKVCVSVCVRRPVQCSGRGQECWCVDAEGQEVVGTRTSGSAPPQCEKHDSTHLTITAGSVRLTGNKIIDFILS